MIRIELRIERLDKDLELPKYSYEHDVAFDVRAAASCVIKPGEKAIISVGIKMEIPPGYAGLIWDRSGLAAKNSLHTLAGVIDPGYRGEIKVVMVNLSKDFFEIEKGMRIAQMLIVPISRPNIVETDLEDDSERGDQGFGSSGVH